MHANYYTVDSKQIIRYPNLTVGIGTETFLTVRFYRTVNYTIFIAYLRQMYDSLAKIIITEALTYIQLSSVGTFSHVPSFITRNNMNYRQVYREERTGRVRQYAFSGYSRLVSGYSSTTNIHVTVHNTQRIEESELPVTIMIAYNIQYRRTLQAYTQRNKCQIQFISSQPAQKNIRLHAGYIHTHKIEKRQTIINNSGKS